MGFLQLGPGEEPERFRLIVLVFGFEGKSADRNLATVGREMPPPLSHITASLLTPPSVTSASPNMCKVFWGISTLLRPVAFHFMTPRPFPVTGNFRGMHCGSEPGFSASSSDQKRHWANFYNNDDQAILSKGGSQLHCSGTQAGKPSFQAKRKVKPTGSPWNLGLLPQFSAWRLTCEVPSEIIRGQESFRDSPVWMWIHFKEKRGFTQILMPDYIWDLEFPRERA